MSRENGESHGLWPADDQVVPLSSPQRHRRAFAQWRPGGGRTPEESPGRAGLTAGEFTTERMIRPSPDVPSGGWRRVVFSLSGGRVAMGPSPEELRRRELVARVKTPIAGCRKVAFISRKGGVGKTSTCLLVGHTFATHRGDRVIALDGNPDAGTLGHRVRRETTANLTSLLADAAQDRAVRGHPRLHLAGAEPARGRRVGRRPADHAGDRRERVPPGDRAARAPLQPRLPRHRHRRARIGHARNPRLGRSDRRRQRSEPRRSSRRKRDARLARRERLPAPRRRVRGRAQRGRPHARRRRRRPDRGALRQRGAAPASASPGIRISRPAPRQPSTSCSPQRSGPTSSSPRRSASGFADTTERRS